MSAYGYDDEGEREHDCCDRCGRGSCPGSGSRGEDACTDHRRSPAPPLSLEERAVVDRFDAAPDGLAECECGKDSPFDGGVEGICECCSCCGGAA